MKDRRINKASLVESIRAGLIVSCQAMYRESPSNSPDFLARMAIAACRGGACCIRANEPDNIKAVREAVTVPVIGLFKDTMPGYEVYITPTLDHARAVVAAGADIVALDGTKRPRPGDISLADIVRLVHSDLGALVMLDISTYEEGIAAGKLGADIISTTLSGYTEYSPKLEGPDFQLVERLSKDSKVPVVAEGRFDSPDCVRAAFDAGAFAVVVGRAITDPEHITRQYVNAISREESADCR